MSKILQEPVFKPVLQSSLANVQENMDKWYDSDKEIEINPHALRDYCIWENGKYRFKRAEDFTEIVVQSGIFVSLDGSRNKRGITIDAVWKRRYTFRDSFCPLWFEELDTTVYILYYGSCFVYKSDAQLKRFCKTVCENRSFIIANNELIF